jgi:hypothetical protein
MKPLFLAAALLFPLAAQAQSNACFTSTIADVDSAGTSLTIHAGWLFNVFPGQDPAVKFWEPLDKLKICPLGGAAYEITNLHARSSQVEALRQF